MWCSGVCEGGGEGEGGMMLQEPDVVFRCGGEGGRVQGCTCEARHSEPHACCKDRGLCAGTAVSGLGLCGEGPRVQPGTNAAG